MTFSPSLGFTSSNIFFKSVLCSENLFFQEPLLSCIYIYTQAKIAVLQDLTDPLLTYTKVKLYESKKIEMKKISPLCSSKVEKNIRSLCLKSYFHTHRLLSGKLTACRDCLFSLHSQHCLGENKLEQILGAHCAQSPYKIRNSKQL